jgi:hypothetical protein
MFGAGRGGPTGAIGPDAEQLTVRAGRPATRALHSCPSVGTKREISELVRLAVWLTGWFEWVRWIGVAYLGIRQWIARRSTSPAPIHHPRSLHAIALRGVLISLTNPRTSAYYGAFLLQFLVPTRRLCHKWRPRLLRCLPSPPESP